MTSVEPGVLDANVLAYAINADAPQHVAARSLPEAARDPSTSLYVTSLGGLRDTRALTARQKPITGCLRLALQIYWHHGITGRRG
jgi:predicted nucleic acid-binding protein